MSKILKQLNDNKNKFADTNGIMQLQAWDCGVVQGLTNKKITATIANGSGFLFDLDLVSIGTKINLDFKDSQLQKLTPDTYFLEIKVTDKDGDVSVFPTEGYATFTINKNLHATEGALVPQITFDTVLADVKTAMDKTVADYVKTIAKGDTGPQGPQGPIGPKGDKGDTGTVDNAGLVTAPAFINLQTQVDNSAVGTNLIAQSDLKKGYLNIGNGMPVTYSNTDFYLDKYIATNGETTFTLSSPDYVFKGSTSHFLSVYDSDKNYLGRASITSATQTVTNPNAAYIRISIHFIDEGGVTGQVDDWLDTHRYKLEKGNVATDWCPSPTEILTQADYAKIQAAIVALGGSLS